MPRYYFHICNGANDIDDQGQELPDEAAARREAARYGGGLLHDDPDLLVSGGQLRINVTDESGAFCFAVVLLLIGTGWPKQPS